MRKENVIKELCKLSTDVGGFFNHEYAHGCFCGENKLELSGFQFQDEIMDFIKEAVNEKMYKEMK